MIVKRKGKKPDTPEGLEYKSVQLNPDGETYTVTFTPEQEAKLYISAAQCQVQLDEMGLLESVQTYMNNQASSKERIFWTVGKNYYRYSPTIEKLGQMLEIDLDEFWAAARKIVI